MIKRRDIRSPYRWHLVFALKPIKYKDGCIDTTIWLESVWRRKDTPEYGEFRDLYGFTYARWHNSGEWIYRPHVVGCPPPALTADEEATIDAWALRKPDPSYLAKNEQPKKAQARNGSTGRTAARKGK